MKRTGNDGGSIVRAASHCHSITHIEGVLSCTANGFRLTSATESGGREGREEDKEEKTDQHYVTVH